MRDLYAAGWLLGECASALPPDKVPFQLINELAPRIEERGYAGLSLRFATLRLILNEAPRPSVGTPSMPKWTPAAADYDPEPNYTPPPASPAKPQAT
jgi:hypothetical protein